jgi:hypothetical protein
MPLIIIKMKKTINLLVIMLIISVFFSCKKEDDENPVKDEFYLPIIKSENFVDSITNPYLPIKQGKKYSYQVQTDEGKETIEINITNETKTILGVKCIVVTDILKNDKGEIIENTTDWYAQDKDGNVWYFGEDTKEFENGNVTSTKGTWEAGVNGAQPGIVMYANLIFGMPYRQEYLYNEAEDMGKVIKIGETVTTPYGTFNNCLVTEEWSPIEPDVLENKYYAVGIGNVKTVMTKGGNQTVELTNITK